jgi:hypothetical protein
LTFWAKIKNGKPRRGAGEEERSVEEGAKLERGETVEHRWGTAFAFCVSAFCIGQAIQVGNGELDSVTLLWLSAGILACLGGIVAPANRTFDRTCEGFAWTALICGTFFELWQLFLFGCGVHLQIQDSRDYWPYVLGIFFATSVLALGITDFRLVRRVWFPALLLTHLFIGSWILRHSPDPAIDVFVFHRDAAAALVAGENPYSISFEDIYSGADKPGQPAYYGPGLIEEGRSKFGFMYPPLSLLLSTPGHVLAGDFRYSHLAAVFISGLLIGYVRPGRVGKLAAALYLFTPRGFLVLDKGWTEPFAVMLLCGVVFCSVRWAQSLPFALGLLLAVKQYLIVVAPAALLLLRRPLWSTQTGTFFAKAAVTATAITLPFALWDISSFVRSAITFHFQQPFRPDSLSYSAWIAGQGVTPPGTWFGFVGIAPVVAVVLWRAKRAAPGFASAVALILLVFFALSKQAFMNYYYLVIGALCCATAVTVRD